MTVLTAILWGTLFMAQATDALQIEPGKQLPQKLIVHASDKDAADVTIRYLLFVPKDYKPTGEKWPLMLFLHGAGERSNDDLNKVKIHGPAKIVESRPDFPFIVVSPQAPLPSKDGFRAVRRAWDPEELIQLVDHAIKELNVDRDRVYVTGLSMGGYGTWRLASKYPERFAAAVPICGGGNPTEMAPTLAKIPIWAFHGAKDPVVPLAESQKMVDAVKQAGGDVKLTVYPEAEHNSWAETYDNPNLYDWLLHHRRKPQ